MLGYIVILCLLSDPTPTTSSTIGLSFSTLPTIKNVTLPFTGIKATISYSPARPAATLTTNAFSNTVAYSYAFSTTATKVIQVNVTTTVNIIFPSVLANPILLYCANWPAGVYTFHNAATLRSKNAVAATLTKNGTTISILRIPTGTTKFNGILEFPLTGSNTLTWVPVPTNQNLNLIFTIGQRIYCTKPVVGSSLVAGTCSGTYNTVCTYTCAAGYLPHTSTSDKCTVSGTYQFSSLVPCTAIRCAKPAVVDTSLTQQAGTCGGSYNSVCGYTCNAGYNPQTFTSQKCTVNGNYVFSPAISPCLAQCSAPTVTDPITLGNCVTGSNSGTTCTLGCATGFTPNITGTLAITCTNGNWSQPSGACVAITCALPTVDGSLYPEYNTCRRTYNSICNYTCNYGYNGMAPQMSDKCTVNGTYVWSTPLQPCIAQCFGPNSYPTYQSRGNCTYPTNSGQSCSLACLSGSQADTAPDTFLTTCTNGVWSPTTGTCSQISCTVPTDLASRNLVTAGSCVGWYGSTCYVKCTGPGVNTNTQYQSKTCLATGDYQWDTFTCQPLTCYTATIDSTFTRVPGTCDGSYGSVCNLTCPEPAAGLWYSQPCAGGYYSFTEDSNNHFKEIQPYNDACRTTATVYGGQNVIPVDGFTAPFYTETLTSLTKADNYCDKILCTFFTNNDTRFNSQLTISYYNVPLGNTVASNNSFWLYTPFGR